MKMKSLSLVFVMSLCAAIAGAQDAPSKTEARLYQASKAALIGSLTVDMATTIYAMENPVSVSYSYCVDGSATCANPNHAVSTTSFSEVGWATKIGAHNTVSVVAANVALDGGIFYASHMLYQHGGRIGRIAAIALNFVKAGGGLNAGIGNASKIRASKVGLVPAGAFSVSW